MGFKKMQEYDFTLHYLEGKKTRADTLSRRGEEEKKQITKTLSFYQRKCFDD